MNFLFANGNKYIIQAVRKRIRQIKEGYLTDPSHTRQFEQAVLPHLDAAYNLAFWLTCNADDAADVTQEAFLRAFRFYGGFHGGNTRAWILTIVRRTCYSWLKRNRQRGIMQPFDDERRYSSSADGSCASSVVDTIETPETALIKHNRAEQLNVAIAALPEEYREVLILREFEDMSYKDIAGIIEAPLGTVMSRLSRARQRLQQSLSASEPQGMHE